LRRGIGLRSTAVQIVASLGIGIGIGIAIAVERKQTSTSRSFGQSWIRMAIPIATSIPIPTAMAPGAWAPIPARRNGLESGWNSAKRGFSRLW